MAFAVRARPARRRPDHPATVLIMTRTGNTCAIVLSCCYILASDADPALLIRRLGRHRTAREGSHGRTADAAGNTAMMSAIGRRLLQPSVAALLALCGCAVPVVAAADGPVTTRFEMFGFAGVHVLTMRSRTDEDRGGYSVSISYATEGIAKWFIDLTTQAEVSGRIVDGRPQPLWYRSDTVRNGVPHHSRIDYRPDGRVVAVATPAAPDPIAPARTSGTIDNLTAYFRLERQLALTGSCTMTAHVFDGRHAYDLIFSDAGRQTLTPRDGRNFSGQTIACHMVRHYWPGVHEPDEGEGAQRGTIWYARLVPGDLLVPVRTRMDTQLGIVEGYLAELNGRGVSLDLLH